MSDRAQPALTPGGFAAFELTYEDNPSGPAINEPYPVACPASRWLRVSLPGTHQFGTADVPMGACNGAVSVTPILPGPDGLTC